MPECRKCGKKGLFLKIEADTGICLACNEIFAQEGKALTEKVMEARNKAASSKNPDEVAAAAKEVVQYGNDLVALKKAYNLEPSETLRSLIEEHEKMVK